MPITCPITPRKTTPEEFKHVDYRIMRHAFDSQNELGRLCDEVIYRNDLAARLVSAGFESVRTEVPITLTHGDFRKVYRMDLVVNDAVVYELKAEKALVAEHDAQLLNYLFLFGAARGKLVNFRPAQVEARFVNNRLSAVARQRVEIEAERWNEADDSSTQLRCVMVELLEDWGGFLDFTVYLEALTHFFGGKLKVLRLVPLSRNGAPLGNQRMHLLNADTAFRVTALAEGTDGYEPHLRAVLNHSPLRAIQWINLARHRVQFVTLSK